MIAILADCRLRRPVDPLRKTAYPVSAIRRMRRLDPVFPYRRAFAESQCFTVRPVQNRAGIFAVRPLRNTLLLLKGCSQPISIA